MLYATTRSNRDAFTAQRILREKRGSDGGLYVPFHNVYLDAAKVDALKEKCFSTCVAEILNLQFNTHLTSWDVDFAVGRYPVRLKKLNQKIVVGECWHNTQWKFLSMVENLSRLLVRENTVPRNGDWVNIAVRIAVLFGIYAELSRAGLADTEIPFDVSVVSGDFSGLVSAWYARSWGLPIGNIVCCCNENSEIWNLFCHGQLRMDGVAVETATPDTDILIPENLERLICAAGGPGMVRAYLQCVFEGKTYYAEDAFLKTLRRGIYIAVVSQPRMYATIVNAFNSYGYVLSPYDALCYAGLQDYRSRTGVNRCVLLLSEKGPVCDSATIAQALTITVDEMQNYFDKQ